MYEKDKTEICSAPQFFSPVSLNPEVKYFQNLAEHNWFIANTSRYL